MAPTATVNRHPDGHDRRPGAPDDRVPRLSGDIGSVGEARRFVAAAMQGCRPDDVDLAVLLAGELVTNAVVHGGGWFLIEVLRRTRTVRVEVTDAHSAPPRVLRPSDAREHGRGMSIVDAAASAWGTDHRGSHKVVWFEIAVGA